MTESRREITVRLNQSLPQGIADFYNKDSVWIGQLPVPASPPPEDACYMDVGIEDYMAIRRLQAGKLIR